MASNENNRRSSEERSKKSQEKKERDQTLLDAARRRVESEKRALRVVERLLEESVSESFFEDSGKYITSQQFDDVAVERAIERLCGYPLCANKLRKIPSQQYHISLTSKKVFDISERKNFCSQLCYQSFKYYQAQLTDEPIWTRDHKSMPPVKLLDRDPGKTPAESVSLSSHDEVIMQHRIARSEVTESEVTGSKDTNISKKEDQDSSHPEREDVSDDLSALCFSEDREEEIGREQDKLTLDSVVKQNKQKDAQRVSDVRLNETENSGLKCSQIGGSSSDNSNPAGATTDQVEPVQMRSEDKQKQIEPVEIRSCENLNPMQPIQTGSSQTIVQTGENVGEDQTQPVRTRLDEEPNPTSDNLLENKNRISEIDSKKEDSITGEQKQTSHSSDASAGKKRKKKKTKAKATTMENPVVTILKHIQQCVTEWRTEATIRHLYGAGTPSDLQADINIDHEMLETGGGANDAKSGHRGFAGSAKAKEVLRDFESEVARRLDNEEKEEGAVDINPASSPLPEFEALLRKEQEQYALRVKEFFTGKEVVVPQANTKADIADVIKEQDPTPFDRTARLPLVDSIAQVTIRRKILLDRLGKVLPDLSVSLHLSMRDVHPALTDLVRTFKPSSHNIVFKPIGWTLLGILLLHLLAEKEDAIRVALQSSHTRAFLTTMFTQMGLQADVMTDIVNQFKEERA